MQLIQNWLVQSEVLADVTSSRTQLQSQLMRKLDEELEQVHCCTASSGSRSLLPVPFCPQYPHLAFREQVNSFTAAKGDEINMRAKKLLADLEAGGDHARLKVEANRTGAELLQLEAFVNANFKSEPQPSPARASFIRAQDHACCAAVVGSFLPSRDCGRVWTALDRAFMKIIKRHDNVSEQKYRAFFVPKLKAQPFFNERRSAIAPVHSQD